MTPHQIDFKEPAKVFYDLINTAEPPDVLICPNQELILILERQRFTSTIKSAMTRMSWTDRRHIYRQPLYNSFRIYQVRDGAFKQLEKIPEGLSMSDFKWSPDGNKVCFLSHTHEGLELWLIDLIKFVVRRLTGPCLDSSSKECPYSWFYDSSKILVGKIIATSKQNSTDDLFYKPIIRDVNFPSTDRETQPNFRLRLEAIDPWSDRIDLFLKLENQYLVADLSPNGNYLLVKIDQANLTDHNATSREFRLYDISSGNRAELIQSSFLTRLNKESKDLTSVKYMNWRQDVGCTVLIVLTTPVSVEGSTTDRIFTLAPPFDSDLLAIVDCDLRFDSIVYGKDGLAVLTENSLDKSRIKISAVEFKTIGKTDLFEFDRNDRYSEPGEFLHDHNTWGRLTLKQDETGHLFFEECRLFF